MLNDADRPARAGTLRTRVIVLVAMAVVSAACEKAAPPPPPPPPVYRDYYYDNYAYGGDCYWLRQQAYATGSPYWWSRYNACVGYY